MAGNKGKVEEATTSGTKHKPEVCKFYQEGRCRFADECHNLHEGPGKSTGTKKQSKMSKSKQTQPEESGKKPMKTAHDVIKRIQWDEMFSPEFFTIGYLDRFVGIVEDPFTKFSSWGDIVSIHLISHGFFSFL